ncbi:hypothetical protein FRB97_007956 [Tulasnella sp. 331]|nr:hypothetical protein FRB97_007956 [Tulasnella sp. 331]
MNSMDLYDFSEVPAPVNPAAVGSSTGSETTVPQPTLEEEVNQVVGQFGRFWGGFRKQSTTVFESAKKDLGQVVNQAREQVGRLAAPEGTTGETPASARAEDPSHVDTGPSSPISSADKGKQPESTSPSRSISDTTSPTTPTQPSFNSFFSRLQSSLPPQLAPDSISQTFQTIQKQIQPTVSSASTAAAQAASQVDIKGIKTSLSSNLQRIQSNALVQEAEKLAEEYRIKSETMLKEAGEYLKDAVKVVPPEEAGMSSGLTWDGTDMWMFPSPIGTAGWGGDGEARERPSGETMMPARMTRAEALLTRLRRDPEMLKVNPADDATVKERYETYVQSDIASRGGLQGETWSGRIEDALDEKDIEGAALRTTHGKLGSEEEFWNRYFFRIHQVQEEEEKRKGLLEATTQNEEDFSWEDEDDDEPETSHKATATPAPAPAAKAPALHEVTITEAAPSSQKSTPVLTQDGPATISTTTLSPPKDHEDIAGSAGPSSTFASPRESEESYDVLSAGIHSKDASSDDSDWE